MKKPSPGSCFGGFGLPGDATVETGAALTTTLPHAHGLHRIDNCAIARQEPCVGKKLDEDLSYDANQLDRQVVAKNQIRTIIRTFKDKFAYRCGTFAGRPRRDLTFRL